jgi:hypothetical protein
VRNIIRGTSLGYGVRKKDRIQGWGKGEGELTFGGERGEGIKGEIGGIQE